VLQVKEQGLYAHKSSTPVERNINGFTDLFIFRDFKDHTVWTSPEKECVQMKDSKDIKLDGKGCVQVSWDKIGGGCKWVGIGFGWNNWQAKDMSYILDKAAIAMHVRSAKGSFKNFPVAFAFEDYSGAQAYQGFTSKMVSSEFTPDKWTKVLIPLSGFPFKQFDCDPSNIKQFIVQLEADGNIYLDHIEIVPFKK